MKVVHPTEDAREDWLADLVSMVYRLAAPCHGQRRVNRKPAVIGKHLQEAEEQ